MAATIEALIDDLERSYAEAQERMSDPAVYNDRNEAAAVGRRLKELETPYKLAQEWREAREDVDAAREDPDLRELVGESEARLSQLEEELKLALVEKDPADQKDVIVEVRQGVGGDEAAIWAGDVLRMLTRYAESRGFKTELMSANESESGGFKEVVFAVKGDGAYSVFKYEGGTHRVQRVPETESQGRIHTSTATVAVMPEVEEIDVELDENDLKIDVYRSTGPGGQSVNTTDSAVRITHLPTGIVVAMQDEKSQLQNKAKALRVLRARLYEAERERQQAELSATRKSQIGSGERAEKIRTYNYPDSRATDHRVKITLNLEKVLPGGLDEFTEALQAEDRRRALEARPAGWTPSSCSPTRSAGSGSSSTPTSTGRSARASSTPTGSSWRAGRGTSRSPTSWASGASAG
ncbi:MAG: peptide chain release factor 1 [Thermoleophilia bacterium]|nr:peptide chain release factor 1 [Thermoleophilia bacterium]